MLAIIILFIIATRQPLYRLPGHLFSDHRDTITLCLPGHADKLVFFAAAAKERLFNALRTVHFCTVLFIIHLQRCFPISAS